MTAQDLIRSALVLTGTLAQGESPSAEDSADAFTRLNRLVSAWQNQRLTIWVTERKVYTLTASKQTYTIGVGADFNQARPQFLSYAGLILTTPNPDVEIPLDVINVKDWSQQSIKALTSTLPTRVYYETVFPTTGASAGWGNVIFWPTPTQVNDVALYCPLPLSEFAALATDYTLPPGYQEALEYNLAKRLIQAGMGLREHLPDISDMARESLAAIKRVNYQPVTASIDPALWPARHTFNWRIGQ